MSDYVDRDKEIEENLLKEFKKSNNFKYLKDLKLEIKSNIKKYEISAEFILINSLRHFFYTSDVKFMQDSYIDGLIDEVRRKFVDNLFDIANNFGLSKELVRRSDFEKIYCNFARYIAANSSRILTMDDIDKIALKGKVDSHEL